MYLVIVNKSSLNDETMVETFEAHFTRSEVAISSSFYFTISAVYLVLTIIGLLLLSQVASRSDMQIAL